MFDTIRNINQRLPLTPHGIQALKKYPVEALDYANEFLDKAIETDSPFRYLLKICEVFCKNNNLPVRRDEYVTNCRALNISIYDDNYVDEIEFEHLKGIEKAKKVYQRGTRATPEVKPGPRRSDPLPPQMSDDQKARAAKEFLAMEMDDSTPWAKILKKVALKRCVNNV